jgi:hypothetical protein
MIATAVAVNPPEGAVEMETVGAELYPYPSLIRSIY